MAKPSSPSPPHNSKAHGYHVDIRGKSGKVHVPVQNKPAAYVIGKAQRDATRDQKGRK